MNRRGLIAPRVLKYFLYGILTAFVLGTIFFVPRSYIAQKPSSGAAQTATLQHALLWNDELIITDGLTGRRYPGTIDFDKALSENLDASLTYPEDWRRRSMSFAKEGVLVAYKAQDRTLLLPVVNGQGDSASKQSTITTVMRVVHNERELIEPVTTEALVQNS